MIQVYSITGLILAEEDTLAKATKAVDRAGFEGPYCVSNVVIVGDDLRNLNLQSYLFRNVKFKNLSMEECDFYRSSFTNVSFRGVNLRNSNLHAAKFQNCRLVRCNLDQVSLSDSFFDGGSVDMCGFNHADLSGSNILLARHQLVLKNILSDDTVLPSEVTWKEFLNIVVPFLLQSGKPLKEVMRKKVWECHSWDNCPMHAVFGASIPDKIPPQFRQIAREFIALYDGGMITREMVMERVGGLIT